MTATTDPPELLAVPVVQPRRLPPAMTLVGAALAGLFVVLVIATVVVVLADDTPEQPALADLPVPAGIEIVDSMSTCTNQACDGHGVVLAGGPDEGIALQLASAWRQAGWDTIDCGGVGSLCVAYDDLRIRLRVWRDVDPLAIPTLVERVAETGIDHSRLVYVHFYRCGSNHTCE